MARRRMACMHCGRPESGPKFPRSVRKVCSQPSAQAHLGRPASADRTFDGDMVISLTNGVKFTTILCWFNVIFRIRLNKTSYRKMVRKKVID